MRNQNIRADFITLYRTTTPVMHIYAQLAEKYDLSENRIRNIVNYEK